MYIANKIDATPPTGSPLKTFSVHEVIQTNVMAPLINPGTDFTSIPVVWVPIEGAHQVSCSTTVTRNKSGTPQWVIPNSL